MPTDDRKTLFGRACKNHHLLEIKFIYTVDLQKLHIHIISGVFLDSTFSFDVFLFGTSERLMWYMGWSMPGTSHKSD